MKKSNLVLCLLGIIYLLIVLVIPTPKNLVFFSSLLFLLISLGVQFLIPNFTFNEEESTTSRFYGISIVKVFITYLVLQFILTTIFIILASYIKLWIVIVINLIILAFAISGIFITDTIKKEIERQDNNTNLITSNFKQLTIEINCILNSCVMDTVKKELFILVDEFKYSDPVSNDSLNEIELELKESIKLLQEYVDNKKENESLDLINQMKLVLENRNKMCKLNK